MRAISLWQPWASAIALGHKSIETRSWRTKVRGPILIHAAKRMDREQREFASVERALGRLPERLPLGALVARAVISDCYTTEYLLAAGKVGPIEKLYGDYGPERFGWILTDIEALPEPIPFKGGQGFFEVPDEVLG